MEQNKSPMLSEIEQVKKEIEVRKKNARQFEELQSKKELISQKLFTIKQESSQSENELLSKLSEVKNQITDCDFNREKIDQEFQNVVCNLKNNKIVFEEISELISQKQSEFLQKNDFCDQNIEILFELKTQLAKMDREISRDSDDKKTQKQSIATIETELSESLHQKTLLQENLACVENALAISERQVQFLSEQISQTEFQITNFSQNVTNLDFDTDKILQFRTELETDFLASKTSVQKLKEQKTENSRKFQIQELIHSQLEILLKTVVKEKNSRENELKESKNRCQFFHENIQNQENEIIFLNNKFESEKIELAKLVEIAEKENKNLEILLNSQKQVSLTIEKRTQNCNLGELKKQINQIWNF